MSLTPTESVCVAAMIASPVSSPVAASVNVSVTSNVAATEASPVAILLWSLALLLLEVIPHTVSCPLAVVGLSELSKSLCLWSDEVLQELELLS